MVGFYRGLAPEQRLHQITSMRTVGAFAHGRTNVQLIEPLRLWTVEDWLQRPAPPWYFSTTSPWG